MSFQFTQIDNTLQYIHGPQQTADLRQVRNGKSFPEACTCSNRKAVTPAASPAARAEGSTRRGRSLFATLGR